ncbi:MAG: ATP-binding protein [Capsulimonadales bacterium]|nr:ATP-binding protein [Capsulimonadales bacterium]
MTGTTTDLPAEGTTTTKRTRTQNRAGRQEAIAENERRERQIAALYELWRSVPHSETRHLLQRIAERVAAALDGHTCSLLLREKNGNTLRVVASVGLSTDVAESVTLLVGERIAGRVAASGQPILVNKDPSNHPLLSKDGRPGDITRRPEVESALCAPLVAADGAVHGVLCLSRFTPAGAFTESDLRVFSLFAAQAGAAVAQARIIEDLTLAAQEAAKMEREIAQTAHLATIGRMAATVAHELRNPLSSIKGAAQFLLREFSSDRGERAGMVSDFLNIVVDEVNGLNRLTTDLLEFARPTPPQRISQDLVTLIQGEIAFLRQELEAMGVVAIHESYPSETPVRAEMDAPQIGQALRNLLLNAGQAGASRSLMVPIEITVRLTVNAEFTPARYDLTVADNGPGILPEALPRLWEPFYTTKARGSGLGLAHVRRVIEAHGGSVDCGNSPQGGAWFTLSLPGQMPEIESSEIPSEATPRNRAEYRAA